MRFKCCARIRGCVRGNERGFTIVEMMMVMFMSAIVLIAIAVIVTGSHKYLSKGRTKLRLQQDFSLISLVLSRNIAEGIYGDQEIYASYADYIGGQPTQSSGSCLKLYFPPGDSSVFYLDNSDFKIQKADLSIVNLVPEVVTSLNFSQGTNLIQTSATLSKNDNQLTGDWVHAFRN